MSEISTTQWAASKGYRVGDMVTIAGLFRPKWWQFWRRWPFADNSPKTYRVTAVTDNTIIIND